jgi:predicted enzyme related to lactoylglutathione lyase
MASVQQLDGAFAAGGQGAVPACRTVPDLTAALELVDRQGGSVASEIRTAPGVGSWAFVTERDGSELLLWQGMTSIGS